MQTLSKHETVVKFKVEKRRVLVPVGEPCPFGCRYCYTRSGEVGLPRTQMETILREFQEFLVTDGHDFDTIQFGYDGDPFARPERGIMMLKMLTAMGKDVNFSTKASLTKQVLSALGTMNARMKTRGRTLSALVSLSCWDSAAVVEPHTPTPVERLATVTHLKQQGLPVFIAVRPVLPHIADEEYHTLIRAGIEAGCDGFILGPLYADDRGQFVRFIPAERLLQVPRRRGPVSWSAHAPVWTRYEEVDRLHKLSAWILKQGGRYFHSSADAMALVSLESENTLS